jgi:hypothetical protein
MFSYHILKNEIILSYNDAIFNISKTSNIFDEVISLLRFQSYDIIRELLDIEKGIEKNSNKFFTIVNGSVYSFGKKVNNYISNKVLYFYENDLPFENLINFWNNLIKNESEDSINELYKFLEYNKYPLTDDGCFIAYKKVTTNFKDCHTETIDNSIGSIVSMDRNDVCSDRNITCSAGLHVASYEYAKCFYGTNDGILIQVKVNPKDVVSVPYDYDNAKLRCCKYEVISAYDYEIKSEIYTTLKIGNYTYSVEKINKNLIKSLNLLKRKPSAVPKSLKLFNDLNLKKCFIRKTISNDIEYYVHYINNKKEIYFKFTKV